MATTKSRTGTRQEWLTARLELLKDEKELTRRSDELARRRQELPWVRIDKEYRFETEEGSASLAGLVEYNYEREPASPPEGSVTPPEGVALFARMTGTDPATYVRERPGMSAFALEDGVVYHTYSAFARGLDVLWGAYQWLDRAPKGRNEKDLWWRRHDEYPTG